MTRRPQDSARLDAGTTALVRLAAAVATGDVAKLRDRMVAVRAAQVPPVWVEELLLQSLLNVGYPLALAAFAVWRDVAGPVSDAGETLDHAEWDRWNTRGAEACAQVY